MRNDDGVYIGVPDCKNYVSIVEMKERTCCGNRKYKIALIKCKKWGIMEAETSCLFVCDDYESKNNFS